MDWPILAIWTLTIIYSLRSFFKWKYTYWSSRGVPTLPPSMLFGSIKGATKTRHSREIFGEIYEKFKGKTPFAGVYLSVFPAVVVIDLNMVRNVLIKDFDCFQDRPLFYNERDDPLSAHILALRGDKWRNLRATLSPTFSSARTRFMFSTVVDVSRQLVQVIHEELNHGNVLEMQELLARFTTDVIGSCAFGLECNSLIDPEAEFRKYGRKYFMEPRHSQFTVFMCAKCPGFARALRFKLIPNEISAFFTRIIHETIKYREKYNVHRNDFLDMLIPLKAKDEKNMRPGELTVNEIAAQAFTFFLAGFETSSTTLCFAIYELACNPSIQQKARIKIEEVLEQYDGELTYDAIAEMHYVDQIVNETLRKYTPITRLLRYTTKDYQLSNSSLTIEKNIPIFIPIYSIHNDPEFYPNPDVFDPDRFSPAVQKTRHPMAFLGFGDGPRNCLGIRFGRMQTRIGIVSLLKNFEFKMCSATPKPPLQFFKNIEILTSINGINLEIKKIESNDRDVTMVQ